SLGLRSFNEVDFVEHLVDGLQRTRHPSHGPAPSLPPSEGETHVQAKLELINRVRAVLREVEAAAVAAVLAPLELPPTLSPDKPEPGTAPAGATGVYRSGFALFE